MKSTTSQKYRLVNTRLLDLKCSSTHDIFAEESTADRLPTAIKSLQQGNNIFSSSIIPASIDPAVRQGLVDSDNAAIELHLVFAFKGEAFQLLIHMAGLTEILNSSDLSTAAMKQMIASDANRLLEPLYAEIVNYYIACTRDLTGVPGVPRMTELVVPEEIERQKWQ